MHEPVLFEPVRKIRVSCAMFKVTSFVGLRPYFNHLNLDNYIIQLKDQLTNIVTNSENNLTENDLSKVTDEVPL